MATPGQPSPEQMAAMQQQFAAEAAKRGMTPQQFAAQQREQLAADAAKLGLTTEQYVAQLRMRAMQAHQQQQKIQAEQKGQAAPDGQQAPSPAPQQHQHTTTQQVPVNPNNPPDPKALAVANWLRSQNLKPRTCIMDGQRKDMFKGEQRPISKYVMRNHHLTGLSSLQSSAQFERLNPPPMPKPPQRRTPSSPQ
jgi:translocation protein SEC62